MKDAIRHQDEALAVERAIDAAERNSRPYRVYIDSGWRWTWAALSDSADAQVQHIIYPRCGWTLPGA